VSLSDTAYRAIKTMIVTLALAPESVVDESALQAHLGIGRTPIREALLRLERDQFVHIAPRRGIFVTAVDVDSLATLFETRAVIEPYASRLAAVRGTVQHWDEMDAALARAGRLTDPAKLLAVDRRCHEIMWDAAGNRYLTDTLDTLYTHSERVWHVYLRTVADMRGAVDEHREVLRALRTGDAAHVEFLVDAHVRGFDHEIHAAAAHGPDSAGSQTVVSVVDV
jgi:DNA-binding GntR family transcriptional regulator